MRPPCFIHIIGESVAEDQFHGTVVAANNISEDFGGFQARRQPLRSEKIINAPTR